MLSFKQSVLALGAAFAMLAFAGPASAQGIGVYGLWGEPPEKHSKPSYLGASPSMMKPGDPSSGGGRPSISGQAPQSVAFANGFQTGSIVIDTAGRKLYYTLSKNSAYVYPIAVGKQGFSWTGVERVSRVEQWPDWIPPAEMRQRKPGLPVRMTGGVRNPLGARAIYLGNTLYRIHGTNEPKSIGSAASSGCFRMLNENVVHLAQHVNTGTTVYVMRRLPKSGVVMPPSYQAVKQAPPPAAEAAAPPAAADAPAAQPTPPAPGTAGPPAGETAPAQEPAAAGQQGI